MRLIRIFAAVLAFGLLATACNQVDFKKTRAGVTYKVFGGSGSQKIAQGDFVKFYVIQKINDSVLRSSYKNGMAEYMQVNSMPAGYDVQSTFAEIFPNAKEGDSLYIVHSVDSFLAKNPDMAKDSLFKKGAQLISTVRVVKVFKKAEEAQADYEGEAVKRFMSDPMVKTQMATDDKTIQEYLAQNNIQARKTDLGTYIQTIEPGSGATPASGKFALVRYKGMDMQGNVFDSNVEPGKPVFPLQIGMGGSIKGFEDGILQLKKGGKARLYIPSMLGYGPQGAPPRIQPNQILVFEVTLEDVTATPPASMAPPQGAENPAEAPHSDSDGHGH